MTKRKTEKAQKGVEPILEKMQNRVGHLPPEMVFFKHNPGGFIKAILSKEPEEVAEKMLRGNTGATPEIIAAMKAEPEKEFFKIMYGENNEEVLSFPRGLTFAEALQYAKEMKEAIEKAFEARLKKVAAPAQYPLSLSIVKGLTGAAPKEVKCLDENKLNSPAYLKLEHIFLTLLSETSAQRDPKADGYLTGNLGAEMVPIKGAEGHKLESAGVEVDLKEIFKRWKGGEKLGATDKRYIAKTIKEYRELVFIWQYKVTTEERKVLTIEHPAPRVGVIIYKFADAGAQDAGGELITQAGAKIVLRFHPAFLAFKIGDKYANTPTDLAEIIEAAAGGGRRVTAAHWLLFHYLNSFRSTLQPKPGENVVKTGIGRLNLMSKIGLDKYLHGRNESKGEEALRGVIRDIQKTGLLNRYTTKRGQSDTLFVFEINKDPDYIPNTTKGSKGGDILRKRGG